MVNGRRGPCCTIMIVSVDITKLNCVTMTWNVTMLQSICVYYSGTFPITDLCSNRAFHSFNNPIPLSSFPAVGRDNHTGLPVTKEGLLLCWS